MTEQRATSREAVALAVALALATVSGVGIADGAARALATLRQVMPTRLLHRIDAVQLTAIPTTSVPHLDPGVLPVTDAVADSRDWWRPRAAR